MTIRPIIFSGPMVRALLDGRKTQTRRIIKAPKKRPSLFDGNWSDDYIMDPGNDEWRARDVKYAPGDLLYVRENHYIWSAGYQDGSGQQINYMATEPDAPVGGWTPSIHMPRWASRLTLEVTDVRVQRLHDISDADAKAEGIQEKEGFVVRDGKQVPGHGYFSDEENCLEGTPFWAFRRLWESINGKGAWDENPYVAAITFKVHRCNVDKITP